MTAQVKNICIILSVIGIIVTGTWYYQSKDLEPLAAFIFALVALIGLMFTKTTKVGKSEVPNFQQKAGKNSEQYQAGRDINVKK